MSRMERIVRIPKIVINIEYPCHDKDVVDYDFSILEIL